VREKIIRAKNVEKDIEFDGKLIFARDCRVKGSVIARAISSMGNLLAWGSIKSDLLQLLDISVLWDI